MPPLATLWQGKLRPNTDLTFHICAPHNARPPSQFAAWQMVASVFANGFLNRYVAHANASQLRKEKRRRVEDLSDSHLDFVVNH